MTEMATIPIYGKHPLKIFSTSQLMTLRLVCSLAFGMWFLEVYPNDDSRLTFTNFMARSIVFLMRCYGNNIEKLIF